MPIIQFDPPQGPTPPRPPLHTPDPNEQPPPFDTLIGFSWRDSDYPLASISVSFEHDLAEHRYVGVDGANVEGTGRGPMKITAKIPFFNGIAPGKGEHWQSGDLYPSAFRDFMQDMANRDIGSIIHPELGEIRVKPHSFEQEHDPLHRDGVLVTATWVETIEDVDSDINLDNNLPQVNAQIAAVDLDANNADIRGLADGYTPPVFTDDFDTFLNKIAGIGNQFQLQTSLALNKPAQMLARIKRTEDAITAAATPLTWPISDACERMKNAMFDLANSVTKTNRRPVKRYTTPTSMTLSQVGQATGAKQDDLINLNPQLLQNPTVNAGTVVRYYG